MSEKKKKGWHFLSILSNVQPQVGPHFFRFRPSTCADQGRPGPTRSFGTPAGGADQSRPGPTRTFFGGPTRICQLETAYLDWLNWNPLRFLPIEKIAMFNGIAIKWNDFEHQTQSFTIHWAPKRSSIHEVCSFFFIPSFFMSYIVVLFPILYAFIMVVFSVAMSL